MGVALLISLAALAACPDREALTAEATTATIDADLFLARTRLTQLERAFGCGPQALPEQLARLWLLEGALAVFADDRAGADEAFAAAARLSPGLWIEDLGMPLRERYEDAPRQAHGSGLVDLVTRVDSWWVSVDGQTTTLPAEVGAGLHLLQVGPTPEHTTFAQVFHVMTDSQTLIQTGQVAPTAPPPVPPAPTPPPNPTPSWRWHPSAGVGLGLFSPRPKDHNDPPGSPLMLVIPIEAGIQLHHGPGWGRVSVGGAPSLGSPYLPNGRDGAAPSRTTLGGHLAGGLQAGILSTGLLTAYHWPGRAGLRAMGSAHLGDHPLAVEARAGLDMPAKRPVGAALEVLLVIRREPTHSRAVTSGRGD